jgi:FlaA1/EpsC-like NDP-sugar epimerase
MHIAPPASQNKFRLNISLFDLFWIILSPFIALGLRDAQFLDLGQIQFNLSPTFLYVFLNIFVSLPVLITFRINESLSHLFTARDALSILAASSISIILSVFLMFFLSRLEGIPRTVPFIHVMVLSFGLLLYRLSLRSIFEKKLMVSPFSTPEPISLRLRRIVVVGLGRVIN